MIRVILRIAIVIVLGALCSRQAAADGNPKMVYGKVSDANDCEDGAWHIVHIYYEGDEEDFAKCQVGPEGSVYACDCGAIPGRTWRIGDEVFARVIDRGDGYTAGPVSTVITTSGPELFPEMKLTKAGIVADLSYPNCPDRDNDYINDASDDCIYTYDPYQGDSDNDGIGNACDKCNGPCPCGAVNLDTLGIVDFLDFSIVAAGWAEEGAGLVADVDGNERIDFLDLLILADYWLADCTG